MVNGVAIRRAVWALLIVTAVVATVVPFMAAPQAVMKLELDRRVPMRDGITLSADVYRPDAPGKYPVVLVRTPYDNGVPSQAERGRFWTSHGYVYVVQDVRGRGDSDGEFYPLVHEAEDGDDTITWCGTQPWSNGKVGMTGGSYLGWVQMYAAGLKNKYLAALIPMVTPPDPHRDFPMQFGVISPPTVSWLLTTSGHTMQDISHLDLTSAYEHLPLVEIDEMLGRKVKAWGDWFDHPTLDAYWKSQAYQENSLNAVVPMLHVSGWYDDVLVGTTENYVNLRTKAVTPEERNRQWLLIGPWGHATNAGRKLGAIDFGSTAVIDFDEVQVRWFDHWLKGVDNGIEGEPHVRIFVMGENRWRTEEEWPVARTEYASYYLHSAGRANSLFGDGALTTTSPTTEPADKYRYDPADPVPFITEPDFHQIGGPDDYRAIERRDDVLVYTGAVLAEPLEVCGPLTLKLYASSSARDTDWTAKLLDVHPSGFAQRLNDGIVRARFRKDFAKEEFLTPGKPEEYNIDCWSTCTRLDAGHRLRVEISSSAFPKFDRNLNTGGPIGKESHGVPADQAVYHDRLRPSHVIIPVVRSHRGTR